MNKKLVAAVALLPCLLLAGCVGAPPTANSSFTTVAPAEPTPTPSRDVSPAAEGIVDTVYVQVFPGRTFKAKHGCRCTLPDSRTELFPAGTPVVLIRFSMTGEWKPAQGSQTSQDVTGATLKGTKFDGRPEPAVLDTADGPAAAKAAHLPWLPDGLFPGHTTWTLPNDRQRSFAAAWYLPAGVDQLLLTMNVPSEGQPLHLTVPLPTAATNAANPGGE